jgi:twitching motility protein PilI
MTRASKLDLRSFQNELAARLASKTAAQVESSRLSFAAGGHHWLIRLSDAAEVIAMPAIVPVPFTTPWLVGVANIRGNLHTVIDFGGFLGETARAARDAAVAHRLVVFGARAADLKTSIVVERVLGLRNLAELAPASSPQVAPPWYSQRWMDAEGCAWQEIDLPRLAHDPAFLQVGQ